MKLVLVGNEKPRWSHNNPMSRRIGFYPFLNRFVDGKPKNKNEICKDEKLVVKMLTEHNYQHQLFSLLVRNAAKLYKTRKLHKSTHSLTNSSSCTYQRSTQPLNSLRTLLETSHTMR